MSVKDVVARVRKLRDIMKDKSQSREVRQKARTELLEARAELQKRKAARPAKKEKGEAAKKKADTPADDSADADADGMDADADSAADDVADDADAPAVEKKKQPPKKAAAEEPATPPAKAAAEETPAAPAEDKAAASKLDGNSGDAAAEKQAADFMASASSANGLNDKQLRKRLVDMRNLMASNKLSAKTEKALRVQLRKERDVLRGRVDKAKPDKPKPQTDANAGSGDSAPKGNAKITRNTPREDVLKDRRRAEDLQDDELRIRLRIWVDFQNSDQFRGYDEPRRRDWIAQVNRDRELLRRRLENQRTQRRANLGNNNVNIVIRDNDRFNYGDLPEDNFAAEVDDDDIERALLAPPRERVGRRVSVEEYAEQPELRRALTRIEVDTIRFGFNEAFVREEEVDNLDRIASVMERVLAKYPNEVFLIEGHTDAVGDNSYNQKLSKARAEAVKNALATYYVLPAKNLKTVGMGERYLKIPTSEAEQENRRVSISRATAVIGGLAD